METNKTEALADAVHEASALLEKLTETREIVAELEDRLHDETVEANATWMELNTLKFDVREAVGLLHEAFNFCAHGENTKAEVRIGRALDVLLNR